jgi:hypothetical protein
VFVVFGSAEPSIDLAAHKLTERVADDMLIASALDLARRTTDPVGIATGDLGLKAKLRSRPSLKSYSLSDEYRLPEEVDPDQKELSDLRAKIARMEAQRPELRVSHKDEVPFYAISGPVVLEPVETLAEIKARFPLKPPTEKPKVTFAGLPWVDPSETYNERVRRYWSAWEDYQRQYEAFGQFLQRMLFLEVELWNDGGKPATDIDVYVSLPKGVSAIEESDLPKVPEPPKEPSESSSFMHSLSRVHDLNMPWMRGINDGDGDIIDNGSRIRFRASKLKHDFHLSLQRVVLAFDEGTAPHSFEAEYKASCAETKAVTGTLRFALGAPSKGRSGRKKKKEA